MVKVIDTKFLDASERRALFGDFTPLMPGLELEPEPESSGPSSSVRDEQAWFIRACRPRRVRGWREFAESLFMPTGPRKGQRFRVDYMPWTGDVLDEFQRGFYRRYFATGPTQSGKTWLFFIVPIMYGLFELEEDVIVGVPVIDMAQAIYEDRLLPAINANPEYKALIPTRGAGSRGGKFLSITFANGATLRFMGAGGGDEQRSSHTARIVVLTELDKMDDAGKVSRESDPVTQIEERSAAFGDSALVFGECTRSIKEGRVNREVKEIGTDTHVHIPCAHCGEYVWPDREHFTGWQDADTMAEARANAGWVCSECGAIWNESDRAAALLDPVFVSKGQTVDAVKGRPVVMGDTPETNTFGFQWGPIHSAMRTMAGIAEREWLADKSDNQNDMRGVHQFVWALTYDEALQNLSELTRDIVILKITKVPKGVMPDECVKLTVFIDVGLYRCWWTAWAWRPDTAGYLIDYGCIEVPQGRQAKPEAILTSLRTFRADTLEHGWVHGGQPRVHDVAMLDAGYQADLVEMFVKESGRGYYASKGMGSAKNEKGWKEPKRTKTRQIGNEWAMSRLANGSVLIEMHSDYWKRQVHNGFSAPVGVPGSLHLYHAEKQDHLGFARQITAEQEREEFVPGKGPQTFWDRKHRDNHYFDCTYGCRVAADMLGIRIKGETKGVAPKGDKEKPAGNGWKIGR